MEGNISFILPNSNDKDAKFILYDNIDTTQGQSGSPVYLKKDNTWILIGVHTGHTKYHGTLYNKATGISLDQINWIEEIISHEKKTNH